MVGWEQDSWLEGLGVADNEGAELGTAVGNRDNTTYFENDFLHLLECKT